MMNVSAWTETLRNQMIAVHKSQCLPKNRDEWLLLRERWNRYTAEHRAFVLRVAGIEGDFPLERYSNTQKRAIATAIADMNAFAKADFALISRIRKFWRDLEKGD
ncbi:hypothetical protein ACN9OL_08035 [Glaesserella parasuis]|uniref:hypothetical protein n=1 Tax=Glaesserella parasuis TaxID=738 RepID=UPI003B6770BC